jgi:hypothetical protein
MRAAVFDRYGRRLDDDDVVPDGGAVRVPLPFMDAMSARTNRAFMRDSMREPLVLDLMGAPAGHRSGYAVAADDWQEYDDALDPTGQVVMTPGEQARQRYILRLSESWKTQAYAKQHKPSPGLPSADSEDAYERYKWRLSNAWRNTDDNAEGVSTSDPPDDIAQLPMAQQQVYCNAYNQHMEENPESDEEECDQAGREAIAALGQNTSVFEAIRTDAQRRYAERITNAWKT